MDGGCVLDEAAPPCAVWGMEPKGGESQLVLLIVAPNLCLDRVVVVPNFKAGRVHRADSVTAVAGGKGMNVARVARALGGTPHVIGVVGGATGRKILDLARADGIVLETLQSESESRTCTLIVDPADGETVINEAGTEMSAGDADKILEMVKRHRTEAQMLICAGSLPPGAPSDLYARIITECHELPAILDASGEALSRGLQARPHVVKMNRDELGGLLRTRLPARANVLRAARRLRDEERSVLVTLGAEGALLLDGRAVHFHAPRVRKANTVGAGDSLTAGLAVGMTRHLPLIDAVRLGMAAAAADVETLLPGTVNPTAVEKFLKRVKGTATKERVR